MECGRLVGGRWRESAGDCCRLGSVALTRTKGKALMSPLPSRPLSLFLPGNGFPFLVNEDFLEDFQIWELLERSDVTEREDLDLMKNCNTLLK